MAERLCHGNLPIFAAMVAMECLNVLLKTLFKAATLKGMSTYAFIVYSQALAALLLLPAPFLSHRSRVFPPLSLSILRKIGLLGLMGTALLYVGYTGIRYSSPTLSSAMANLTPAFTFILAIIFRMEKLCFQRTSSKAKVLGTIVSITGAFVVTLYKGPPVIILSNPSVSLHQPQSQPSNFSWAIAGALFVVEYTLISISYIVQAQIMKEYPAEFSMAFFYMLVSSVLCAAVSLVAEKNNPNAWTIRPDITLVCIIITALFGACGCFTINTWAVRKKGPVFAAMFKPLSIAIAVIMGVMFLGEPLYLGSLIGAVGISFGFYTVMWGKAKEEKGEDCEVDSLDSPDAQRVPLLNSYRDERV